MTNRTLMDVFSDIDDSLIEEAAHPELLLKKTRKRALVLASRKWGTIAACMAIAIGLLVAVPYINGAKKMSVAESMTSASDLIVIYEDFADAEEYQSVAEAQAAASQALTVADAAVSEVQENADVPAKVETTWAVTTVKGDSSQSAKATSKSQTTTTSKSTEAVTTTPHTQSTEEPMFDYYTVGEVSFRYSDQALYGIVVDDGASLMDLVIPETIAGVTISEIYTAFWSFAYSNPFVQTVTIPDTVTEFGNVSALNKSVVIICSQGSAAEKFFTENGYTVQYPQL